MKDRVRALRKFLKMNQTDFGKAVGVTLSSVTKWETGENVVSDAVLLLMCQKFGVSEEWLRTGEGEMFVPRSREEEIAAFVHEVCGPEGTAFQRRLISLLARLTVDEWKVLERIADKLANEKEP